MVPVPAPLLTKNQCCGSKHCTLNLDPDPGFWLNLVFLRVNDIQVPVPVLYYEL